ncbi:MAG: D-hexose-6-phosphate mutarotase [Verrucomicrobiia bacterium]
MSNPWEDLRDREIPGVLTFAAGGGGLPKARITTRWSTAEIYLHGAQVTAFEKNHEPPVLFLSEFSRFAQGKAIRGGVPICFPWFGPREGDLAHGYARIADWDLVDAHSTSEGGASLRFRLPNLPDRPPWSALRAEFIVKVGETLRMELDVMNESTDRTIEFENCLHTYFSVGDIAAVSITGLESAPFVDHVAGNTPCPRSGEALRIASQTDRTYCDSPGPVEISDASFHRTVRIEKTGSASTVVWNPWTTQPLADFGPEERRRMVCVESGNIGRNKIALGPDSTARMCVELSTTAA